MKSIPDLFNQSELISNRQLLNLLKWSIHDAIIPHSNPPRIVEIPALFHADNGTIDQARAVDSTQVKTPDRGLRVQWIGTPVMGVNWWGAILTDQSPVRDWESQGVQYTK